MTPREALVLVRLFEATTDPALRRWAIERVPELSEWDTPQVIRATGDPDKIEEMTKNWSKMAGYEKLRIIDK